MNKKADVSQVFIYISSVVVIGFVGFLVVSFVSSFLNDTNKTQENIFVKEFESSLNEIYKKYNSEDIVEYRVPSSITFICILDGTLQPSGVQFPSDMINDSENLLFLHSSDENIGVFDENGLISSKKFETPFEIDLNKGFICIEPINNRFEIFFENRKNEVFVDSFDIN